MRKTRRGRCGARGVVGVGGAGLALRAVPDPLRAVELEVPPGPGTVWIELGVYGVAAAGELRAMGLPALALGGDLLVSWRAYRGDSNGRQPSSSGPRAAGGGQPDEDEVVLLPLPAVRGAIVACGRRERAKDESDAGSRVQSPGR
jgi:hypothetical protein